MTAGLLHLVPAQAGPLRSWNNSDDTQSVLAIEVMNSAYVTYSALSTAPVTALASAAVNQ